MIWVPPFRSTLAEFGHPPYTGTACVDVDLPRTPNKSDQHKNLRVLEAPPTGIEPCFRNIRPGAGILGGGNISISSSVLKRERSPRRSVRLPPSQLSASTLLFCAKILPSDAETSRIPGDCDHRPRMTPSSPFEGLVDAWNASNHCSPMAASGRRFGLRWWFCSNMEVFNAQSAFFWFLSETGNLHVSQYSSLSEILRITIRLFHTHGQRAKPVVRRARHSVASPPARGPATVMGGGASGTVATCRDPQTWRFFQTGLAALATAARAAALAALVALAALAAPARVWGGY
eukprot:gene9371-biopygen13763